MQSASIYAGTASLHKNYVSFNKNILSSLCAHIKSLLNCPYLKSIYNQYHLTWNCCCPACKVFPITFYESCIILIYYYYYAFYFSIEITSWSRQTKTQILDGRTTGGQGGRRQLTTRHWFTSFQLARIETESKTRWTERWYQCLLSFKQWQSPNRPAQNSHSGKDFIRCEASRRPFRCSTY